MRDAISRLDMREKSIPQRITVSFFFFFFKLSKKNIYLFFFFMVMVNLGSTDYSRYTGYREITDRDVLDLQCIHLTTCLISSPKEMYTPGSLGEINTLQNYINCNESDKHVQIGHFLYYSP